jgi:MoxR-like ATPase
VSHIELKGSAGSGKTLAVHKLAEQLGKKLAVVTADGGLRKRDLIGQREIANGTTYFDAGEFATSAKNGDWALLDEANFADADALGFLNGMTDRAGTEGSTFNIGGKVIPVHPDFRCFITRNQGYAGTKNMNEALRDRFWTIEVPPLMDEDLVLMLRSHGMLKVFAQDASFQVTALYKTWENNQINYQVSPRRALVAWQLAEQLGSERKDFRELLTKSILTKIDAKHDKEAIAFQIKTNWSTLDSMEKRGQKNNG